MPAVTVPDWTALAFTRPGPLVGTPTKSVGSVDGAKRARGRRVPSCVAPSPGGASRSSTPLFTWTRWEKSTTPLGQAKGTPWHPHRGFETVTYMIDGTFAHQDSNGGGGLITDGATQWMTAGRGILHIETPPEALVVSGGLFHGIQLWVNLPAKEKSIPPAYQPLEAGDVALVTSANRAPWSG